MPETIIINQPTGLGDILFTIPIARHFISNGARVIYPYDPIFGNIGKHFPDIFFVPKNILNIDPNKKIETIENGVRIIPIRWSNRTGEVNPGTMLSKYQMMNLPVDMWRTLTWDEDKQAQSDLAKLLKLPDKYILVNETWHHTNRKSFLFYKATQSLPVIKMQVIHGFTLIDWCEIMRNAVEFHTVGTSNVYLIDLMEMNGDVHLYQRPNELNFDNYNYLLKKKYIYHEQIYSV